ncbi:MAG: hypothetical protein IJQ74_07990 [Synergistaceae bacterium]|nr:hypothetical protein [Synergistaceae bacterium]
MLRHSLLHYEIRYEKPAEKFFAKHEDIRSQYKDELNEFLNGDNPERVDVKAIKGKKGNYYRMRIGQWRIIFALIDLSVVVIDTVLAGSRGDVYKKIGGLR